MQGFMTGSGESRRVFVGILISVIGPSVFIVQPGFVQGLVSQLNMSEQQAGYIAAVEMWGIAASTLAMTFLTSRMNWRWLACAAIFLITLGNLASVELGSPQALSVARGITGVGSGVLISLGFTIIGLTSNPDRNFGHLVMWVLLYGAAGLLAMPFAFATFGFDSTLIFFALFSLSALPFIRYLPRSGSERIVLEIGLIQGTWTSRALSIITVFIFFVAVGCVWTYLSLIGVHGGASEQSVGAALMVAQLLGAFGAYMAARIGNRAGRATPINLGLLGCALSLFLLLGTAHLTEYTVAISVFNFCYNMVHPYLYAAMASIDPQATIFRQAVAAQMLGLAIGPSIAAMLVKEANYDRVTMVGGALFALAIATMAGPLRDRAGMAIR
jgi:predicted MFS family arabinose efflux permease